MSGDGLGPGCTTAATPTRARHRRIVALAVPAVATLVADPLLGIVDTAVVGRLGVDQLGAMGLALAILTALSWVFNFLVFGTTSAVARAVGGGDRVAAGRRIAHAGQVAAVLGVAVGVLLLTAAPALLRASGAVDELIGPAAAYLRVRAIGVPFLLIAYVGHGAFRGVSDTRTPLVVVAVANLVNAVLTVLLVFPAGLGLVGAAWGTVAAEVMTVAVFAGLLHRVGLPLAGHGLPDRAALASLVVVSRDLFLRTGALTFGLLAVTAAAARTGAVTAAAHQVLWQVWIIVSFLMDGFAIAAQAMIGTALGAGDVAEARATARALRWWGVGGGVVIAALLLAAVGVLPGLFTDDVAVLTAVGAAWWIATGGHALNGLVFVLDGVLMGAEDFAYLRTWTMAAAATAAVGAQLAASAGAGIVGIWVALQLMMFVRLASLALRVRGGHWLRTGTDGG